jgi:hypothetical protein
MSLTGALSLLQLVRSGRTVIAAVRSADKAFEVFEAAGLKEGYQQPAQDGSSSSGSGGILITAAGVDVTDAATLTAELFEGVTQVRPNELVTMQCSVLDHFAMGYGRQGL